MADPLSNAAPVGPIHGFPGRGNPDPGKRNDRSRREHGREGRDARDEITVHGPALIARRLLRERVLWQTRRHLGLGDGEFVPSFAEAVEAEPVGAFVGRLIGAQNQLAALCAGRMTPTDLRGHMDEALREGVEEVVELLSQDAAHDDGAAVAFVAEVLHEYARRLTDLV